MYNIGGLVPALACHHLAPAYQQQARVWPVDTRLGYNIPDESNTILNLKYIINIKYNTICNHVMQGKYYIDLDNDF